MIERFANNRLYRVIFDTKAGQYKVIGCEAYNAIVDTFWLETDEIYYFDHRWEVSKFLTDINGGVKVFI